MSFRSGDLGAQWKHMFMYIDAITWAKWATAAGPRN